MSFRVRTCLLLAHVTALVCHVTDSCERFYAPIRRISCHVTEQCTRWQLCNAYTGPILFRDRFHFHVSVSAPLPKFSLISCAATLLFGAQRLNQFVEFDLWGHLNENVNHCPHLNRYSGNLYPYPYVKLNCRTVENVWLDPRTSW